MSKAVATYNIAFNTMPGGYLRTVKVTIEEDVMDAADKVRVDLCDNPLYKELQTYVKNNPR